MATPVCPIQLCSLDPDFRMAILCRILVGCSFFGPIPESIGSLQQLVFISLTSNSFTGPIPPSIGNLSKLSWLDLSDNKISGTIPISHDSEPGLNFLVNTRNIHLSKNQLSGPIQPRLFGPNMKLIHLILDHNKLMGEIPESLGSLPNLEVLRLDWNSLNGPVPSNLTKLQSLNELGMSNNSFNASDVPQWFTSLPLLKTIGLANNKLNGTLDIGTRYGNNLTLDLRNNSIQNFTQKAEYNMNIS
ncbi:hypothetical protein RND71_000624 [Anisodus tanguticus]|uniref:Uncharacterized protein n=1 Tax=Anisodus tanguticus TaxID=243964 RepID=A0AAE1SZ68_9SOLA|nr:hypothetical protein RND71_000624 [Anisodus tanguticus]